MKTIRKSTFESNSSSSHTITFSKTPVDVSVDIVEDGVLYADRLKVYEPNYDQSVCIAKTRDEKAAWAAMVINCSWHGSAYNSRYRKDLLEFLATECGYDYIEVSRSVDGVDDEGEGLRLDTAYNSGPDIDGAIENLRKFIHETIMDDSVIINDVTSPI